MRLGAFFVAVCMAVIAASAGAVGYFAFGLSGADAFVVAVAVLTGLSLYNGVSTRAQCASGGRPADRRPVARRRRSGASDRASWRGGWRRSKFRLERSLVKDQSQAEPLAAEISELGTLVNQLAETVAVPRDRN